MIKLIPFLCLALLLFSCKKDSQEEEKAPDFYISFKLADSNYIYKVGDQYTYGNEGSSSTNFGEPRYTTYTPRTSILPLPYNANKKLVGFSFHTVVPECYSCDRTAKMIEYGNALFPKGEKTIGYTGYTSDMAATYEIYSPGGVAIYWLSENNKYFASTSGIQPSGSFFSIDTVMDRSYLRDTYNWDAYEKIITGRFQCRIYDPANKTVYKDLAEGRFCMPVWKTKY